MAIALNVISIDRTRRKLRVVFAMTFSGNYSTGGDIIDFTKATDTSFLGYRIPRIAPEVIEVNGAPGGTDIEAVIGTTNANSKIKQFTAGSGNAAPVEQTAGALPAAVTGDLNCNLTAVFGRGAN